MAQTFISGCDTDAALDRLVMSPSGCVYDSTNHRGRAGAPPSAKSIALTISGGADVSIIPYQTTGYVHCWMRIGYLPSSRTIFGFNGTSSGFLHGTVYSDGHLEVYNGTTLVGTSASGVVTTSSWHWFAFRTVSSDTPVDMVQIDGITVVTGTPGTISPGNSNLAIGGSGDLGSSSYEMNIDGIIVDDSGFLPPHEISRLLIPIADISNTLWLESGGTTTDIYAGIDDAPAHGVASANEAANPFVSIYTEDKYGTAPDNNYVFNLATYDSIGITSTDILGYIDLIIQHGEDIATGTKTGVIQLTDNPSGEALTFTFGLDAGAHGVNPGGWRVSDKAVPLSGITISGSPQVTLYKSDSTTRRGCVEFVGANVSYQQFRVGYGQAQAWVDRGTQIAQVTATGSESFLSGPTGNSQELSQTFTLSSAVKITTVYLNLKVYGTPTDTVTMYLRSGNPPTQNPSLGSATLDTTLVRATDWYAFSFITPVYLQAGSYCWDVTRGIRDTGNYVSIQNSTSDVYPDGSMWTNNSGSWGSSYNDFTFRLFGYDRQSYGQAQAKITAGGPTTIRNFAQAQADIKATTRQWAQGNADIKATYRGCAQANAWIRITSQGAAQAQTGIKTTSRAFAQANADVKASSSAYAQSQATIKATTRGQAQAQADIKQTYPFGGGLTTLAQDSFTEAGSGTVAIASHTPEVGTWQASLNGLVVNATNDRFTGSTGGESTAFINGTVNGDIDLYVDTHDQIVNRVPSIGVIGRRSGTSYYYAHTDGYWLYIMRAPSLAILGAIDKSSITTNHRLHFNISGNSPTTLRVRVWNMTGQEPSTWDLEVTDNTAGNQMAGGEIGIYSTADTDYAVVGWGDNFLATQGGGVTGPTFAQAQAKIVSTNRGYAQAQANIKQTYQGYAQSQAGVKATGQVYAQAQAKISAFVSVQVFAQAQAGIRATYQTYAQAQTDVKASYQAQAQANAWVKLVGQRAYAQGRADVKTTYITAGQSQADIKATSYVYGQAQVDIKASYQAYAQSQADIKATYRTYAQSQADIKATSTAFAQTQSDIRATYRVYAQANADIKATSLGSAQSKADIKATSVGSAQAGATISAVSQQSAQAQAFIYIPQIARPISDISNSGWLRVVI